MKSDAELQNEVNDETADAVREFDFEAASMLMGVIEKQANVAPRMTSISGLAAVALEMLNEHAKAIAAERAQRFNEKVAERTKAENERMAEERQAEKDQQAANAAAQEKARADEAHRAENEARRAEAAKVPLTSEHGSPKASPQPTLADNARRM